MESLFKYYWLIQWSVIPHTHKLRRKAANLPVNSLITNPSQKKRKKSTRSRPTAQSAQKTALRMTSKLVSHSAIVTKAAILVTSDDVLVKGAPERCSDLAARRHGNSTDGFVYHGRTTRHSTNQQHMWLPEVWSFYSIGRPSTPWQQ